MKKLLFISFIFLSCIKPNLSNWHDASYDKLTNIDSSWTYFDSLSDVPKTMINSKMLQGTWFSTKTCVNPLKNDSFMICKNYWYDFATFRKNKYGIPKQINREYQIIENKIIFKNECHLNTLFVNKIRGDSLILTCKFVLDCTKGKYSYERKYYEKTKWYINY